MKKLLSTLAAFTALTAAASAADLPRRAPPPVFTPVPVFTWTGAYFGINAGYAFDASEGRNGFIDAANNPVAFNPATGAVLTPNTVLPFVPGRTVLFTQDSRDGFSGGGQVGYNYQFTPGSGLVIGIEADAQYLDFGGRRNNGITFNGGAGVVAPTFAPVNGNLSALDYFGTARGRIGFAFDRALFYGTGGFAYAGGDGTARVNNSVGGRDGFRTGWTAGAGVEYALPTDSFLNFFRSSAVTIKVEGLYVSLDRNRSNLSLVGATSQFPGLGILPVYDRLGFNTRREDAFAVVRAGLNYKFGSY
ncbi:outer membrane protein [Methylobacterium trifolii]|uniref:Porin n=1 Tax=Methylobacterium trifolii TaxID=1003092 RepID=A0ABQ4TT56_9HYPH|nr:porin family protein [Methylobacterium trifolii]GJE58499.1 hypothetical protein MPOCJGCO_0581 [Methylobacterium trifolii]